MNDDYLWQSLSIVGSTPSVLTDVSDLTLSQYTLSSVIVRRR
jgi:hypothetical protein